MWKNMAELDRPQTNIKKRRMRFAFWITKATDIHSQYVILLPFVGNSYANASQCYVYTKLPV